MEPPRPAFSPLPLPLVFLIALRASPLAACAPRPPVPEARGKWAAASVDPNLEKDMKGPRGTLRVWTNTEDFVTYFDEGRIASKLQMGDKEKKNPKEADLRRYEDEVAAAGASWHSNLLSGVAGSSRGGPSAFVEDAPKIQEKKKEQEMGPKDSQELEQQAKSSSRTGRSRSRSAKKSKPAASPDGFGNGEPRPASASLKRGHTVDSSDADEDGAGDEEEVAPKVQWGDQATTTFGKWQRTVDKLQPDLIKQMESLLEAAQGAVGEQWPLASGVAMALNAAMLKAVALARIFLIDTPLPTLQEISRVERQASSSLHPRWCSFFVHSWDSEVAR